MPSSAGSGGGAARTYPSAPVVGVAAMVERDGRFLLVKRARPPNAGAWGFPGGRQELGETIEACAMREVREETGIIAGHARFVTAFDVIERDDAGRPRYHYTVLMMQLDWEAGEGLAADDAEATGWFTPEEARDMPLLPRTLALMTNACAAQPISRKPLVIG